jgi:hypothetical protein
MKLTIEQVLEKWQDYTLHIQRIQELKDLLFDLKTVHNPEDLGLNEKRIREIVAEIRYTYIDCMIPVLKDILAHVEEYKEMIADILRNEKDESVVIEMREFLENLKSEIEVVESSCTDPGN